jgi:hypothetical protein
MPGTVTIACKMPNGVILNLDRYERISTESFNPAVREIPGGQTVTLKGVAYHIGLDERPELHGGYRLNEVDADFWESWYELNKDSPLIKDGLIFAAPKREIAASRAREQNAVPQLFPPARGDEVSGVAGVPKEERQPA